MSDRVTIKSIADLLGISHMTVSRALSENPNVHPDTRRAVRERAAELGYVKSAAASAMRGEATRIVGLMLPDLSGGFHAGFAEALARGCEDRAQHLILHLTGGDAGREQLAWRRLREMQARAIIRLPADGHVVEVSRPGAPDHPPCVMTVDDGPAIAAAVEHLLNLGHRHIAYIGPDRSHGPGAARFAAFAGAMAQRGHVSPEALIFAAASDFAAGQRSVETALDGNCPVSAVLCAGADLSDGALAACLLRGLSLPGDLAFVGYGDGAGYGWVCGGVSTIAPPVEDMAGQVMALVLAGADAPQGAETRGCGAMFLRRATA